MSFGKPNYGENKGFKKKNNFNTSGGDVIARILPPWGPLEHKGVWHVFHFESPLEEKYDKETNTKTTIVPDAALDRYKDFQAKLKKAKEEKNVEAEKVFNQLVGFGGTYNVDNNVHMNVLLLDGRAGEFKIRYKMFLALKSEIDKLRKEGDEASNFTPVDPLSLEEGRFFVFHKEGKGNETSFKVTVYQETLDIPNVGKVRRPFVSKVSSDVLARLGSEMFDLDNLFPKLTAEEVAKIVATSDLRTGKSPAINEFIDNRRKTNRMTKDATDEVTAVQPTTLTATVPSAVTVTTSNVPTLTSTVTTVETSMGAIKERLAPEGVPPTTTTFAKSVDEMSDEDFFKQLEAR
jgi:hypothetical protein